MKSIILDEVKNLSPAEQQFKNFADYSIAQKYNGVLEKAGILVYRVYDIEMENKNEKAVLRYQDPKTGEMTEIFQKGRYNASVRGYFLWILPVKHFSITAKIEE